MKTYRGTGLARLPHHLASGSWDATQHDRGLKRQLGIAENRQRKETEKCILGVAHPKAGSLLRRGYILSKQSTPRHCNFCPASSAPTDSGMGKPGSGGRLRAAGLAYCSKMSAFQ